MTFNPAIPAASDPPSLFPTQSQTNYSRLQTLVSADHQFNLSAAANDGYHNIVHLTQQAPVGGIAVTGQLYAKLSAGNTNLFYMNESGTSYQITPSMPIRAAVNFVGTGAIGACVLRSSYNVTSVTKTATGLYTVTFTTAMPDADYIVQVNGMAADPAFVSVYGSVVGNATYSNSVTTALVKVSFFGGIGFNVDVTMGSVTIFSVT